MPLATLTGCERTDRRTHRRGLQAAASAVRTVEVVHPLRQTVRREVGVPGQLQAFETTPIHAKIAGYVKRWCVNIGDNVKKGQLLAELTDPELDADHKERLALIDQAIAKHGLAPAAVKVAEADVASERAKLGEVHAGVSRAEADVMAGKPNTSSASSSFTGSGHDEALVTRR